MNEASTQSAFHGDSPEPQRSTTKISVDLTDPRAHDRPRRVSTHPTSGRDDDQRPPPHNVGRIYTFLLACFLVAATPAHAQQIRACTDSSTTQNNVFNSDAPDNNGGTPLCSVSGTGLKCTLSFVCGSSTDVENEARMVRNSTYYSTKSFVIQVFCAGSAPTEYCSVYDDPSTDITLVEVIGTAKSDFLSFQGGGVVLRPLSGAPPLIALLSGSDGDDILVGSSHTADYSETLAGGADDDHLIGHSGPDTLLGNGGNDLLKGDNGDDVLEGGTGRDLLLGGPDSDRLRGEDGDDLICGHNGNGLPASLDTPFPGTYADPNWTTWTGLSCETSSRDEYSVIHAGAGDDVVHTGRLIASSDGNWVDGGAGYDRLFAYGNANAKNVLCDPSVDGDELDQSATDGNSASANHATETTSLDATFTGNIYSTACTGSNQLTRIDCASVTGHVCPAAH